MSVVIEGTLFRMQCDANELGSWGTNVIRRVPELDGSQVNIPNRIQKQEALSKS